ncbi:Flp pilus assembly protein CpaB [Knoellia koreensis]|uniref:SAF domain-containing protein n=1 Tax=Knoellia koreensis TaxID=2730921 RepID=A0A849HAJ7_9MICO|nr:SAF domain-containing protein [Knoellia sp. DB2414S]NNM46746.1 hypothetical protein [Knoellia sp. DB2414S]
MVGMARRLVAALGASGRRADWRRHVLRRLLAAGCAVVAVLAGLAVVRQPADPTVPVLVAARAIPAGAPVEPQAVRVVRWPARLVPEGAVRGPGEVLGRVVVSPVARGETLTASRFSTRSLLAGRPTDQVAVHVSVADEGAVAMVSAGDRVDLVGAGTVVARDVEVLRVDRPVRTDFGAVIEGQGSSSGYAAGGPGLVVAADPRAAEAIAGAPVDATGRPDLRVLLRPR